MSGIFISATSDDLGSYRRAVRDVLLSKEVLPLMQDHFPPDYRSVVGLLEEKIRHCDAMICLVGSVYGREPRQRPDGEPRRSYTQLEYAIARRLGKPVYLFTELLREINRLGDAEPLLRRALAICCAAHGSQHPNTQTVAASYQRLLATMDWSAARIEGTLREVLQNDG